jgi:hypothetical protein
VHDERLARIERTPHELSPTNSSEDSSAGKSDREVVGAGGVPFERARIENLHGLDSSPDEVAIQTAANNLDLGKFGHC